MDLDRYLNSITEINYFISGNHKYYNFKKFEDNKNGKLFIVGLSGSGKTTLGKQLANKYDTEYIELDDIDRKIRKKIIIQKNDDINNLVQQQLDIFFKKILQKQGGYIVEGINILYQPISYFKDKSVIIMETSVLLSTIRAYNRNVEKYKDKNTRIDIIQDIYKNQTAFIKRLKKFEKEMISQNGI